MSALIMPTYRFDAKSGAPIPVPFTDAQAKIVHDRAKATFAGLGARMDAAGIGAALQALAPHMRMDATGGLALERELTHISALTSLEVYAELTSDAHFPSTPDMAAPYQKAYIATGASFQESRVSHAYNDRGGSAAMNRKILATNPILPAIQFADYTIDEVGTAALANLPLPAYLMQAARRAVEEKRNAWNWFGDSDLGILGLYNNADINKSVVANGAGGSPLWVDKTPQEIYNDCANLVKDVWTAIKGGGVDIAGKAGRLKPNRLVLGTTAYAVLATTPMATNAQPGYYTILQALQNALKAGYGADFEITSAPELDSGGGPGGTSAWMVAYRYDGEVAGRVLALPGQFGQPEIKGFTTSVPYHTQAGGLSIRYPVAVRVKYGM